jgi:hypothetical protein
MADLDTNMNKKLFSENEKKDQLDQDVSRPDYNAINIVKTEDSKYLESNFYNNIITHRHSSVHVIAFCLYNLGLISFSFLTFQIILISRVIDSKFILSVFEMSMLISLTFAGIASGMAINSYYLNSSVTSIKLKVITCSSISCAILLFSVISRSDYLLFLSYTLFSLFLSITFYSIKDYFEVFYLSPAFDSFKSSTICVITCSTLFVYLNYSQLINNWNYCLIALLTLNVIITILSIFMEDSPTFLFKLREYENLVALLEKIKEKPLQEGEREGIYEELRKINEIDKAIKVSTIFSDDIRYFSIFYFTITCIISFNLFGMTLIGVNFCYDTFYNIKRSVIQLFYFIIIAVTGPFLGWFLSNFTVVKRKIYILCHFLVMIIFAFLSVFFNNITHFLGGIFVFFSLSLLVIFMKFGWEVYVDPMHKKTNVLFSFTIFFFAMITVLIVNPLYFYNINAALISIIIFSLSGLILTFFIDRDVING